LTEFGEFIAKKQRQKNLIHLSLYVLCAYTINQGKQPMLMHRLFPFCFIKKHRTIIGAVFFYVI